MTKKEQKINQEEVKEETAAKVGVDEAAEEAQQNEGAEATENIEEEKDPLQLLQEQLEKLTAEKEASDNQMLRLQADFDNFRKRTRTEKEEWRAMIVSGFCSDILPVLDNFRWAVMAMEKDEAAKTHLAGVQMILNQLQEVLKTKGVEAIKSLGEEFNPKFHDAMGQIEVEDEEKINKVLEEITTGYKIGEKVIRPARVRVGTKKSEEPEQTAE